MYEHTSKQWLHRPLLTETLPYEVPVIFSNDKFFLLASRSETLETNGKTDELTKAISKLLEHRAGFTIPYNYPIRKDSNRTTTLSVVHPLAQIDVCNFYHRHRGALLSYCSKSEYSIRYPVALAAVYAEPNDSGTERQDTKSREGFVQANPGTEELDTTHITSYFAYERYNILAKFFDSKEFLGLEAKFKYARTLDISKCFYNIYTHSISWAVKDKEFAKKNLTAHSFEAYFDKSMQHVNYNETNGIVVGPEISRIFAEIILQEIDLRVQRDLLAKNLFHNKDYSIRRYVDDYSVFSRNISDLDAIEHTIADHLETFKLYLNLKKVSTTARPFVTPLTLAKNELSDVLRFLGDVIGDTNIDRRKRAAKTRSILTDIRSISKKFDIELANLSGLLVSHLKLSIVKINANLEKLSDSTNDYWADAMHGIVELLFYTCSLDPRVRTTYSLCQAIKSIFEQRTKVGPRSFERIQYLIHSELLSLTSTMYRSAESHVVDHVELFNVMICGAHYVGPDFAENSVVREILKKILNDGKLTYFKYVTLKFCFLKDRVAYSAELGQLNSAALDFIEHKRDPKLDSEAFLMLFDFLSAPDIENREKRRIFEKLFGGTISTAAMNKLAALVGFVDWSAMHVDHALKRKELRPIYAVA